MLTNCHLAIGSLEFEQGLSEDDHDDCGEDDSHKDDSDEDEEVDKESQHRIQTMCPGSWAP